MQAHLLNCVQIALVLAELNFLAVFSMYVVQSTVFEPPNAAGDATEKPPPPKPAVKAAKPDPGEKPAKPLPAKSKPTLAPAPAPATPASASNGPSEAEAKAAPPKPRIAKTVSGSAIQQKESASANAPGAGDKPVLKPARHKPGLPPSVSASVLPGAGNAADSSGNLYDNPVRNEERGGLFENVDASEGDKSSAAVAVRPRVKPPRPVTTLEPGNVAVRKSIAPPKPARPQSSAPTLSPTDPGFPDSSGSRSPSPGARAEGDAAAKGAPTKPTRR